MAETGASTLSLESEVNLAEAKRITENKVCVSGNIDSFKLAFSPKEEVFQMAKACVLETSPGGRFILSSSCEVTANTPPENLDALIQAAEEYGKYR
jgi:uroporphyrinogen-III decarboxylase